jgi:hypothetical protein
MTANSPSRRANGPASPNRSHPSATGDDYDDVPVAGVPEGLRARVRRQLRTEDTGATVEVRDRRRRTKLTSVFLYPAQQDGHPAQLTEQELTFLLGADRRNWDTIEARLGRGDSERAWTRVCDLVRGGAVELECEISGLRLGHPICWRLTPTWQRRRKQRETRRRNERAGWDRRADSASERIRSRYPELALALARHHGPAERKVLVHAAEDLLSGRSHHGPRAFSQRHFGTTKARDDVGRILERSGVETDAQIELGVLRGGRTCLAGPITLRSRDAYLDLAGIKGPSDLRLDQEDLVLSTQAGVLLVIENRQAAEAASDHYPQHAMLWTQGMMGRHSLDGLRQLSSGNPRVIAIPDADLGGVRIAEQILRVVPGAEIVDIGGFPHVPREMFKSGSVHERGLQAATGGPASALAEACLVRRYPVEQELASVEAIRAILTSAPPPQA